MSLPRLAHSSRLHFVLDISGNIATTLDQYNSLHSVDYFIKNNFFLSTTVNERELTHILHPGCIEFIQYLQALPNVIFSFFSDHSQEYVSGFVKALLTKTFGADYHQLNIGIHEAFSDEHIRDSTKLHYETHNIQTQAQYHQFSLHGGRRKKDLTIAVKKSGVPITHTVLIDRDASYVDYGQVKNYLFNVPARTSDFNQDTFSWYGDTVYKANHIFYLVGLINELLKNRDHILDTLFSLQFKKSNPDDTECQFRLQFSLTRDPYYYFEGLRALQKINPGLDFYVGEKARLCFQTVINQTAIVVYQRPRLFSLPTASLSATLSPKPNTPFSDEAFVFINEDADEEFEVLGQEEIDNATSFSLQKTNVGRRSP
jgi:hypothetical protein